MHTFINGEWKCSDDETADQPLPERDNGYRVVAICKNCGESLTLWENYRGDPGLVHVSDLKPTCPIWFYAEADRSVPELGLFDPSNLIVTLVDRKSNE